MCYAEQSMEIFEDLIYQKEMEIAALDYQVQAYRYKLLSLSCNDPGVGEIKFPENLLQRNETLIGETSTKSILRMNSAPPVALKLSYLKKATFERERSESPDTDLSLKVVKEHLSEEVNGQNMGSEKQSNISAAGNINSYLEQIRELDEQVRQIAGEQYANLRSGSKSPSQLSQGSTDMSYDAMKGTITNESEDQLKHPQNLLQNEAITNFSCSLSVHDVFEVPQTSENLNICVRKAKAVGKLNLQCNERCGKPDLVPNEAVKLFVKDQADCLNEVLLSKRCEPNLSWRHDGVSVDCHLAIVSPTVGVSESQDKFQQVNGASEIVEIQSRALRQEPSSRGEEELKLLNEIREQLNSIQSEIKRLKSKKSLPSAHDLAMQCLAEAMLHFWL